MGEDITVPAVGWGRLESTPVGERLELLEEAACPETDWDAEPAWGWVIPASPKVPWCGRYEFHSTNGSYKPHFWAGERWDDVRAFGDPVLRDALDGFVLRLIRGGEDADEEVAEGGPFPTDPEPWRPRLLLVCPPDTVRGVAARVGRDRERGRPVRLGPARPALVRTGRRPNPVVGADL
ncbi:hypothetical protein [Streptomyces sp. HUAS ZL42]|uniref:hypothetical protein n=1 Tax=Streptomyces sp. HUAS ZL42 TaxID=3231715 RepID=UPI00345EF2CF